MTKTKLALLVHTVKHLPLNLFMLKGVLRA